MDTFEKGRDLIREFKGDRYFCGKGVLGKVGKLASSTGRRMQCLELGSILRQPDKKS